MGRREITAPEGWEKRASYVRRSGSELDTNSKRSKRKTDAVISSGKRSNTTKFKQTRPELDRAELRAVGDFGTRRVKKFIKYYCVSGIRLQFIIFLSVLFGMND